MASVLYRRGTLGILMAGLLKGTASINELLQHGDLGIATLADSNGEVIFLDGKAYHVNEHKESVKLKGDELTPYATVIKFIVDTSYEAKDKSSEAAFAEIKGKMLSEDLFSAVKISGLFKKMHVRMTPAQEPPYTHLIDLARKQPEQTETHVKDAVVGFSTPELFHGTGSAGFHVHFADDDRNFGGHVLDSEVEDVKVEIQNIETFEQHFPIQDEDFIDANIDCKDIADEIRETE